MEIERQRVGDGVVTPEQLESLAVVVGLLRSGQATTRPEISERSGLGRTVVAQRVGQLASLGLVESAGIGSSTGGRAPGRLRFRAEAGVILVAMLGATSLSVGLADLAGRLLEALDEPTDVARGPEMVLSELERHFDRLAANPQAMRGGIWGVGIGLPGPVEFATGRPSAPPIMPGWDNYPVRDRIQARYGSSVWVDNEVNTLALGELRAGLGQGEEDVLYVKLGTGIGAGLVSGGHLHRGAKGCAGDIGHTPTSEEALVVCRCGKRGCLEALAGGAALARDGTAAARSGKSALLADVLAVNGVVTAADVTRAGAHGDQIAVELLASAGRLIGETLSTLVSFFNPSLVILGGGLAGSGDDLLATIREAVYRRSLPLATRDLRISLSVLGDEAGLIGAAYMATDELFSVAGLRRWIHLGSPPSAAMGLC